MMTPLVALLTLFASIAPGARTVPVPQGDACALDSAATRDRLVALENTWLQTPTRAALDTILAPDFVHPVASGDFLDKAEHVAWVVSHPRPPARRALGDVRVRRYGDVGIVTGSVTSRPETGAPQRTVFTDVFRCRDGRWQAVSAQETLVATGH